VRAVDRGRAGLPRAAVHGATARHARRTGASAARARDFDWTRQQAWTALQAAPPGRVVQTRHGDRMLLTDFLRTRVLELAVHGLDLAAALNHQPWMTPLAADVTQELLLPAEAAARLRDKTGWNQVTLIAKLTGRRPVNPAETRLIQSAGIQQLALG